MKRIFFTTALFLWAFGAADAQTGTPYPNEIKDEGRAPYRTEFISYDIRGESDADMTAGSKYFRALDLRRGREVGPYTLFEAVVEIPELWLDRDVYIRDTGRTGRYHLVVNGEAAALNTDSYGTNDYRITPLLQAGENRITLVFADDLPGGRMERFSPDPKRTAIENLYIFSQPRIHIFDYTATGHFDEEYRDNVIDLAVVVTSSFNMDETVKVGYDIYDPAGNLVDYTFVEAVIPGQGCDTVRFYNKIMRAEKFQYSAQNPALYRVTLSLSHGGRNTEYIPLKLGFGLTTFDGTHVSRGGVPIDIRSAEGDFTARVGTAEKLRALKKQGFNTVSVTRPQKKWFYDIAVAEGMYVIDRAAVECDPHGGDRGPDGTAANDPALCARFIDRQQAMYYRRRNYPNVIGWSIGSESGNGYNMYKSYLWLKTADPTRAVIYPWAEGEWNSDME